VRITAADYQGEVYDSEAVEYYHGFYLMRRRDSSTKAITFFDKMDSWNNKSDTIYVDFAYENKVQHVLFDLTQTYCSQLQELIEQSDRPKTVTWEDLGPIADSIYDSYVEEKYLVYSEVFEDSLALKTWKQRILKRLQE